MNNPIEFLQSKRNTKEALIISHNTDIQSLLKSLRSFNGLLAPSLAIHDIDHTFKKYGDVSVIFKPHTLFDGKNHTTQSNTTDFIYNMDSYSVRFPEIEFDFNKKYSNSLYTKLSHIVDDTDSDFSRWDNELKKDKYSAKKYLESLSVFKLQFIRDHIDKDYKPQLFTKTKDNISPYSNTKDLSNFLKKGFFTEKNRTKKNLTLLKKILTNEKNKSIENIKRIQSEGNSSLSNEFFNNKIARKEKEYKEFFNENTEYGLSNQFFRSLSSDQMKVTLGRNVVYETKKISKNINNFIQRNNGVDAFYSYCDEEVSRIHINPHIKIGKSKNEPTEENILRYMRKEGALTSEKTMTMGLGKSKTQQAKRLLSFEEIWDERKKLGDYNTVDKEYSEHSDEFNNLSHNFQGNSTLSDSFDRLDALSKITGLRHNSVESLAVSLIRKGFIKFSQKDTKKLFDLSSKIQSSKTQYFESKPLRTIPIHEIEAVVLPRNTPKELRDELKRLGIKTVKHYISNDHENKKLLIKNMKNITIDEHFLDNYRNKQTKNRQKLRI